MSGVWDSRLDSLRAQLAEALGAEGHPALARDLTPATRELAQRLFVLDAMVRYTHPHTPPATPLEHATFYTAQLVGTAMMPMSRMSRTEVQHVRLCEEVLEARLQDMTLEDAIEAAAARHRGERGAGAETIRRAYLRHHEASPLWVLLEMRRRKLG